MSRVGYSCERVPGSLFGLVVSCGGFPGPLMPVWVFFFSRSGCHFLTAAILFFPHPLCHVVMEQLVEEIREVIVEGSCGKGSLSEIDPPPEPTGKRGEREKRLPSLTSIALEAVDSAFHMHVQDIIKAYPVHSKRHK